MRIESDTLERYEYCLKILIDVIIKVTDGEITLDELKRFRATMEAGAKASEDKN